MVTPRKRKVDADPPPLENGTATVPQDLPLTSPSLLSPSETASDTNGNGDARKPVKIFSYLVARDTHVQASIWDRVVTLADGSAFTTHDVSVRKRYRDPQ